jgi:hypothetical protein
MHESAEGLTQRKSTAFERTEENMDSKVMGTISNVTGGLYLHFISQVR